MNKKELYLALCKEAGTYDGHSCADEWYTLCSHNISRGMDDDLARAASGDVAALAEVRHACGLPILG